MSKDWNLYEDGQPAKSGLFSFWSVDHKYTWDMEVKEQLQGTSIKLGTLVLHGSFTGILTAATETNEEKKR